MHTLQFQQAAAPACVLESHAIVEVPLSEIRGLETATVAVLGEAGYRTLNDIINLERDDLLRLPGIAPGEADRIMTFIDELTTEDEDGEAASS